jgi:predicted dinucleotide-binding enzyme
VTVIGIIGSGQVGGSLARAAVTHGYDVVMSNAAGPQTLAGLVSELGPRAAAATAAQAKRLVAGLYDEFGFDAVDIGGLDESWRVDVGQPAFVTRQNMSELKTNVAKAERGLDPGLTPVPDA